MAVWFCSSAIETTFPLSNFKTKHIFGILMERVKFLKPFGAPHEGAPIFFLSPLKAVLATAPIIISNNTFFTTAFGGGKKYSVFFGGAREIPPKAAVSRVNI